MEKDTLIAIVLVGATFFTIALVAELYLMKIQIPSTPNSEFKIVSYVVPDPFLKGHLRFVIECSETEKLKEYYVSEGKLYYGGTLNSNETDVDKDKWVGGISCL